MIVEENKETHKGEIIYTKDDIQIINCEECGYMHISPLPEERRVKALYEEKYYEQEKPDYLKESLKDTDWLNLCFERKRQLLLKHTHKKESNMRILDIGAGGGFFLAYFKSKEWECVGIEPSPLAVEIARGKYNLDVLQGIIENYDVEQLGKYDVINISFVLEHCIHPEKVIQKAYSLLNDNGIIIIESPNDFNPLQQVSNEAYNLNQWWVSPEHHINYFTFDSLAQLLKKHEFNIIERTTSFPMEFFLLMGINYTDNSDKGHYCHFLRETLETNFLKTDKLDYLETIYQKLAKNNLGRTIVLMGRK